ncbi:Uncharacterized protein OBRU01_24057 [Operophtera brumata]|uniref:Uncharacterized protein n=1 Tax=Operophtera brumata TaxID=104452 RepID=A0A0L7KM30_OPEBR|nr:Uncharacterized protein OBRU01_24057 [Operophtera brumata]
MITTYFTSVSIRGLLISIQDGGHRPEHLQDERFPIHRRDVQHHLGTATVTETISKKALLAGCSRREISAANPGLSKAARNHHLDKQSSGHLSTTTGHRSPPGSSASAEQSTSERNVYISKGEDFVNSDSANHTTINSFSKQTNRHPEMFTKSQGVTSKKDDLIKKQISNFKAFARTVSNIDMDIITEKWEFQDILKNLESRWSGIDKVHWELDSESDSSNEQYEKTFSEHERTYNDMKKALNSKLWSMSHREKTTPQMEVPNFHGNYHQWVCFKDLFTEAIHSNSFLSNAQKMQFLKSKVKGEAERLIQHLNISSDNYSICWEILQQRYNNKKMIFSSHMNILLNLPVMQQASVNHIKRIHDTTQETMNAIKNLGTDVTSWDPLIVYILCQKLDSDTHSEYMKSVKQPRELPVLSEFLTFLESQFTSMEASRRKQDNSNQKQQENTDDAQNKENTDNTQPSDQCGTNPTHTNPEVSLSEPRKKRSKISQLSTIVSSMKDMQYDLSKSETVEDEFDIFGKHIAKQLRTLSTEQAILGQEEIQSVITRCRLHDLNSPIKPNRPNYNYASRPSTSSSTYMPLNSPASVDTQTTEDSLNVVSDDPEYINIIMNAFNNA